MDIILIALSIMALVVTLLIASLTVAENLEHYGSYKVCVMAHNYQKFWYELFYKGA